MDKSLKKMLLINTVCYGSTGTICKNIYDLATSEGFECYIAYGRGAAADGYNCIKIGSTISIFLHLIKTRLFDRHGFGSKYATKRLIKTIENIHPDIIHLHNLHGYYLNVKILFAYLKKHKEIKVVWTLHDCWAFTGHCSHYLYTKCDKWKSICNCCPLKKEYPKSIFVDNSSKNYIDKKNIFSGINNMQIVTVSNWLKRQTETSFLECYDVQTIYNGIDTTNFTFRNSSFRERYGLGDEKIILGVANPWTDRKGLNDFIELAALLGNTYRIVLVGVDEKTRRKLPSNIIAIEKTNDVNELAEIYSAADIFFNPTKEETFGLTNVEAQIAGTTVVSYDAGGTKETLYNPNSYLIKNLDEFVELLENGKIDICKYIDRVNKFDKKTQLRKYIALYNKLLRGAG